MLQSAASIIVIIFSLNNSFYDKRRYDEVYFRNHIE